MSKNFEIDVRKDFPLINNSDFAYLDSGATSQKPECVLKAMDEYYKIANANPHRGAYELSIVSTKAYDEARQSVQKLLNARHFEEIVFTKNATESLNLIAYSYGLENLMPGDEVVLSIMEHHSMIVPWQKIVKAKGARLKYLYLNNDYQIDETELRNKITTKTKVVGISSVSNVLGTMNNVEKIIQLAHEVNAIAIVDISQSIAHMPFDVQKTDADFVVFSSHKMYGPLGVGVLYGKKELLEKMPPFLMGGDMIEYVYEDHTTFSGLPNKFEAGTQNVAGAVGLKAAIEYINSIDYENIMHHEQELSSYALSELKKFDYVKIYCTQNKSNHSTVISLNIDGVHPHDVASILDANKVCVRAGNHCAQPLLRYLGIEGTCRLSLSIYNTKKDIDMLVAAIKKTYEMFRRYLKNNE